MRDKSGRILSPVHDIAIALLKLKHVLFFVEDLSKSNHDDIFLRKMKRANWVHKAVNKVIIFHEQCMRSHSFLPEYMWTQQFLYL